MVLKETACIELPEPQGCSLGTTAAQEAHKHTETLHQEAAHIIEELLARQTEVALIEEVVRQLDQVLPEALQAAEYDRPETINVPVRQEVQTTEVLLQDLLQLQAELLEAVVLQDRLPLGLQAVLDLLAVGHLAQGRQAVDQGVDNSNS